MPHVDLMQVVAALQHTVAAMQTDLSSALERVDRFEAVVEENSQLRAKIAALEARLTESEKHSAAPTKSTSVAGNMPTATVSCATDPAPVGALASSWAQVVRKHHPAPLAIPTRRQTAIARSFQPAEGPKGFEYLYLTRSCRMDWPEIRRSLRRLGLDSARILDISFPARSAIGLLMHVQYIPVAKEILAKSKVVPLDSFDPQDPTHLGDPKYSDLLAAHKTSMALDLHRNRCMRTLRFLRPAVAIPVARTFFNAGWIIIASTP
ncbi:uncharacterized protein BYT42DRAFT_544144 [Radiomyces spectabilis]|uniref:uncharacterized protein n=1 Tax=Radiomyces spectabilis TaxID=64574 RepID=UPI00221E8435|nr:uncharacterized protein BYT42DRAFT_544144 [Radiomyces spectabilis]KAI8384214.1 hypothetical protein BYT42DRAFT_544144 [Radiomyces spectabilis]